MAGASWSGAYDLSSTYKKELLLQRLSLQFADTFNLLNTSAYRALSGRDNCASLV